MFVQRRVKMAVTSLILLPWHADSVDLAGSVGLPSLPLLFPPTIHLCPFWTCKLSEVGQAVWSCHNLPVGSSGSFAGSNRDAELNSDRVWWDPMSTHLPSKPPSSPLAGTAQHEGLQEKTMDLGLLTFFCQIHLSHGDHALSWWVFLSHWTISIFNWFPLRALRTPAPITFLFLSGLILTFKKSPWGRQAVSSPLGSVTQKTAIFSGNSSPVTSISL